LHPKNIRSPIAMSTTVISYADMKSKTNQERIITPAICRTQLTPTLITFVNQPKLILRVMLNCFATFLFFSTLEFAKQNSAFDYNKAAMHSCTNIHFPSLILTFEGIFKLLCQNTNHT